MNEVSNVSNLENKKIISSKLDTKKLIIILLLLAIVLSLSFFLLRSKQKVNPSNILNQLVSEQDKQIQSVIQKNTGLDWSNLPGNLGGSEKDININLLLLFNEESGVFRPEVETVNLTPKEISDLKLTKMSTDYSKENFQKLFENLITIEAKYQQKGLIPAKTHLERLKVLKAYFFKYQPQKKHKVPENAKEISGGIKVADNQLDYAKALIGRYNNWFIYATIAK